MTPRLRRWRARTDGVLLILAIGTLPFLLVEIKREQLPSFDRRVIDTVNLVVLVAFAVDYFVELALASDRRAYARHEWTSLLIVITQAIAILPYLGPLGLLRGLRGVRGVRAAGRPCPSGRNRRCGGGREPYLPYDAMPGASPSERRG